MGRSFGHFELRAKIAQGGMAEVFVAVRKGPGGFEQLVAIKQLLPELEDEVGFIEGFFDEARIIASLSHPNICQVLEFGVEAGRHFIAMEYLSGQSLSRIWAKARRTSVPFPPALAAYVIARAAEGLAHAHERTAPDGTPLEIVHRDVSPDNLVVTYDGQVKVVDFGVARAASNRLRTRTGMVRGKLAYMAPEQVQGQPVDARADVFSLGVVLHELLTGARLFSADTDAATVRQLLYAEVPAVASGHDVPPGLASIVEQTLARDPAARLTSARELKRRLDEVLRESSSAANAELLGEWVCRAFAAERAEESARLRRAAAPDLEDFQFSDPPPMSALPPPFAQREVAAPTEVPRSERQKTKQFQASMQPAWRVPVGVAGALAVGLAVFWWWAPRPSATVPERVEEPAVRSSAAAPDAAVVAHEVARQPPPVSVPPDASVPALPQRVVRAPSRPEHRAPKVEERLPAAPGRLTFDTVPWTDVSLDGRRLGATPLIEVEVPAGHHILHLVNDAQHVERSYPVDVVSGQTLTVPRLRL